MGGWVSTLTLPGSGLLLCHQCPGGLHLDRILPAPDSLVLAAVRGQTPQGCTSSAPSRTGVLSWCAGLAKQEGEYVTEG